MAKIARKLTDLVGNTPLMELSGYSGKYGLEQNIIAKLEAFNPAGSVKDRVALSMIEDAEARGTLKPGATIIEPTSGNTGVGLAMVATIKGYHLILTMPETMSLERRNLLKALGAQIVLTNGLGGMAASIAKAQELRDSIPGSVILPGYHKHITGIQLIFPIQYLCPYTFIIYISPFIGTANNNCFIHTVPFITSSKRIDQLSSRDHPYISKTQNPDFGKRITFILRYQFTKTGGIP